LSKAEEEEKLHATAALAAELAREAEVENAKLDAIREE